MKIGIDLDDTICRTTEIVQSKLEKYAKEKHMDPLDIMNDDTLENAFFNVNIEDIYENVEVKRDVVNVLKRLRHKGNEIYIITARGNAYINTKDAVKITEEWLKRNKIEIDKLIPSVYGEDKAEICKKHNIDLMIDDDPYNYRKVISAGINCLLFDDRERFDLKNNYVTNWLDIEKYIERNR